MLNRLIKLFVPNYTRLTQGRVFGLLLLASTLIRFPFFFRDYIDRDESTFILMGQSWVDGYLPYTELWDLKPPITFLFFAGIITVFGKSFLAIRFFGSVLVASTAFFTYKITETIGTKKLAFWAAMAAVALQSMFGSIQGVMSEHLCMAFFVPGMFLSMKARKAYHFLGAGVLMGLAVMTKLNIAYAVLFVMLYLIYDLFGKGGYGKGFLRMLVYGIGVGLIIFLTFLPYYMAEKPWVWWKSVVLASLEYAGTQRESIWNLVPTFTVLSGFFLLARKKRYLDFKNRDIQLLSIAVLGVLFAFAKGGRINSHYLIQLHPLFIVLAAIFISKITVSKKWNYRPYLSILLLLLPAESYLEYYRIVRHKIEKGTFYNGEGITVPIFLKENHPTEKNILFLGYHIGYWAMEINPPTKASTHPSNICRSTLFPYYDNPRSTAIEELEFIMDSVRPALVVTRTNRLKFDKQYEVENKYIDQYLKRNYRLIEQVESADIYQRLE